MSTLGKAYLGNTLVAKNTGLIMNIEENGEYDVTNYRTANVNVASSGSGTEYVNVTFSGGNTFYFVGMTDSGQQDGSVNINSGTMLRVVKNSLILVGKMSVAMNTPYISGTSAVSFAKIKNDSGNLVDFNTMTAMSSRVYWDAGNAYGLTALFATQDITVFADED